jgi:hypothetical protein
VIPKKRGPKPTGKGIPIMVRIQPRDLAILDKFRVKLDGKPSRPEVIRRIIAEYLGSKR